MSSHSCYPCMFSLTWYRPTTKCSHTSVIPAVLSHQLTHLLPDVPLSPSHLALSLNTHSHNRLTHSLTLTHLTHVIPDVPTHHSLPWCHPTTDHVIPDHSHPCYPCSSHSHPLSSHPFHQFHTYIHSSIIITHHHLITHNPSQTLSHTTPNTPNRSQPLQTLPIAPSSHPNIPIIPITTIVAPPLYTKTH